MDPVTLTVGGAFWDSYLYMGRLYLFERDGSLRTIRWEELLGSHLSDVHNRLALTCAFLRSDYLYGSQWDLLFDDPDIRGTLTEKFGRIVGRNWSCDPRQVEAASEGIQDNPFPFPHNDLTIYFRRMYCAAEEGVFSASCGMRTAKPVSTRPRKHADIPAFAVAASYQSLAIAANQEGLFALALDGPSEIAHLSVSHCNECHFTYASIYAASTESGGYLAEFAADWRRPYRPPWFRQAATPPEPNDRTFVGARPAVEIFGRAGYSWGRHDKLYQLDESGVGAAMRYQPWLNDPADRLVAIGAFDVPLRGRSVIASASATFGVVLELHDALLIVESDGSHLELAGAPVNWRVFPRSTRYENQLHVVYEDRLEVMSFNHDYLVPQESKVVGLRFGGQRGGRVVEFG